jgi:endonuclease/exonuclease/phosphatase family metal-dependent hydrolase
MQNANDVCAQQRGERRNAFHPVVAYRRLFAFCILHFAFCIAGLASTPPPDLVVLTWNLHAGAGDLTRLLADLTEGRLTSDGPVSNFVLLLQEAGPDIREFAARRGLSAFYAPVNPERGNAVVSTAPLYDNRTIDLPRVRQRRVAVAATIDVKGRRLRVVTTHLENRVSWWRGGLFSEGARLRQAEALVAALPPGEPTVVGGDFNAWLGRSEPAWQALAARFPDGPRPLTTPTFRQRLFLDEIFFDLPDGWRAQRLVVKERYGSDHHAVIGLLSPAS